MVKLRTIYIFLSATKQAMLKNIVFLRPNIAHQHIWLAAQAHYFLHTEMNIYWYFMLHESFCTFDPPRTDPVPKQQPTRHTAAFSC